MLALVLSCAFFAGFAKGEDQGTQFSAVLEVYAISQAEATEFLRSGKSGLEIYREVAEEDESEENLIECIFVRQLEQDRRTILSVEEVIYGTEGDPPELPNVVHLDRVKKPRLMPTDSTFTAFETRYVGFSWDLVMETETDQEIEPFREASADPFADPVEIPKRNSPKKGTSASTEGNEKSQNIDAYMHLDWTVLKEKESLASDPNDPDQKPFAHKWLPKFNSAEVTGHFTLQDKVPTLLRIVRSPRDTEEMVAIFVTARLLQ